MTASIIAARVRYTIQRLGPPGWAGLVLLGVAAGAAALGGTLIDRETARLAEQVEAGRREIAETRTKARAPRTADDAQQMLARLPAADGLPAFIESIQDEAARRGLEIERAEYRQSAGAALRLQIQLPVRGEYPALRRWLETLLQKNPSLSLDELTLRRTAEGASAIEARVTLSYYARSGR